MTFGEKLHRLRKERGWSQEALAAEIGVSRQAVSRWELGEVVPDTASVLAVSRLFGVSTDYLLLEACASEEDTPAARTARQSLQERQREVGKGFLCRVFWLAPASMYHYYRLGAWDPVDFWYLLALQAVFSVLLYRLNRRYRQSGGRQRDLLAPDLAAFGCVFLLPFLLGPALGTWAVLIGQLAAVVPLVRSVRTLRLHHGLPWKALGRPRGK